jgi:hypothetical protein
MTQAQEDRNRAEVRDMYTKLGWTWVALAYMTGRVNAQGKQLPSGFVQDMRVARTELESGCSSVGDAAAHLRDLEKKLFQTLLSISEGEVNMMLELIGKAMNGTLEQKDVDLSPLKIVMADCAIPNVCSVRE